MPNQEDWFELKKRMRNDTLRCAVALEKIQHDLHNLVQMVEGEE